jgi:hypothetical protein
LIAASAAAAFLSCPWFLQLLFCNALLLSFTYCPARGAHFGFFLSLYIAFLDGVKLTVDDAVVGVGCLFVCLLVGWLVGCGSFYLGLFVFFSTDFVKCSMHFLMVQT